MSTDEENRKRVPPPLPSKFIREEGGRLNKEASESRVYVPEATIYTPPQHQHTQQSQHFQPANPPQNSEVNRFSSPRNSDIDSPFAPPAGYETVMTSAIPNFSNTETAVREKPTLSDPKWGKIALLGVVLYSCLSIMLSWIPNPIGDVTVVSLGFLICLGISIYSIVKRERKAFAITAIVLGFMSLGLPVLMFIIGFLASSTGLM